MQPNCQIPPYAAQHLMQPTLFPQTFLSKTAHAAQLPNPTQPNISCSLHYFHKLFYQKQLMQPNCQIPPYAAQHLMQPTLFPQTFLSKTAHAAQLPNPHPRYAAISNDFSIKNSSCSPTAKSPPSVCSYFQRLFYQKQLMQPNCQIPTLGMQLFPTTFLSKTAHAAQQNFSDDGCNLSDWEPVVKELVKVSTHPG
jgi:hypothetical protein